MPTLQRTASPFYAMQVILEIA